MEDIRDIFEDCGLRDSIDTIDIIDIDIDGIGEESAKIAADMVENLSSFYYNEEFMAKHPQFKKRVENDIESLRVLIKMRKTDEEAHDILIKAIAGNSSNASLYRSLSEMQKTIISITTKISDIVAGLNTLMKGYQLELNFEEENQSNQSDDIQQAPAQTQQFNTSRGTKEFIERMMFEEENNEEEEP
jgi:hypothetical protein